MNGIPRPEHPRPDFERQDWLNLNGEWRFQLFEKGEEEAERAFDRKTYADKITVPFSWAAPLSGVGRDVPGTGWYAREAEYSFDERLFLVIGASDYETDVYVNGERVASHEGGYTPIEAEVTRVWRASGRNTVEVRAKDDQNKTQMYGKQGYGNIQGIWQTVYLERRPESYIKSFRFTAKISGEIALEAEADAKDGDALTARFAGREFSAPVKDGRASLNFTLDHPRLWSPDDPYLYEGEVALASGDVVKTYFGVREISTGFMGDRLYRWVFLNGQPMYINATLDQAFNPKGYFTHPTDADMKAEAWRLKRLGLNAARIHIKCEEPRKLYWMDKLGVMIIADVPNFWGEPCEAARNAYDRAWPEYFTRDFNHPCIFMWVMFNETWGLFTKTGENERKYLPETQKWVLEAREKAKAFDPTRLVEDNSACQYDHVATDINTWHFYIHGYENVKAHVKKVVENTFPGSAFNYAPGYQQDDAPLMNSECGMVWGVDGSAGDSDIAWQYHYMLNEFRLYDKLCGFVFTEFHDVVNEFNGYYRIDDTDKDFGYGAYCRGMTVRDLHAADFVSVDFPPCLAISSGARADVPLSLSSFSPAHHETGLTLRWELWRDTINGRIVDDMGETKIAPFGWGVTPLKNLSLSMPEENALSVLSLYLTDADGRVISRNFTTFDVRAEYGKNEIEIPLCEAKTEGFAPVWEAQAGGKLNMGGCGSAAYEVKLPEGARASRLRVAFEAGAKRLLTKDLGESAEKKADTNFMLGYRVDRGAFPNSYYMTDETRHPSRLTVKVNGETVHEQTLENDPADARGALSWLYQGEAHKLDEAGSYGEMVAFDIPSRLIPGILENGGFTLTLFATNGLSLYGRESGRYALPLTVTIAE